MHHGGMDKSASTCWQTFFLGGGGGVGINSLKVLWVTAGASGKSLRLSPGAAFALLKKVTRDG